ncbi:MAG: YceD family protein [Pseudomonadota bacterium]
MKNSGLPEDFYPLKFASAEKELQGQVSLSQFQRLLPLLGNSEGDCHFVCSGRLDMAKKPVIDLTLKADLMVTCQTCLEDLAFPVDQKITIYPVYNEAQAENIDRDSEIALIDDEGKLDLLSYIEDELILCLPVAPKHEEDCLPIDQLSSADTEITEQKEERKNPFAVLESLKKSK